MDIKRLYKEMCYEYIDDPNNEIKEAREGMKVQFNI